MTERRKGGRPRLSPEAPSVQLSVRVWTALYDDVCARAREEDEDDLAVIVRRAIQCYLRSPVCPNRR